MKAVRLSRHQGFSLMELLFALVIAGILMIAFMQFTTRESSARLARGIVAQQIASFTNAVRTRLSTANAMADFPNPNQVMNGTDWLKSAVDCGGAAAAPEYYLNCNFPDSIAAAGGLLYTTQIQNDGTRLWASITLADAAGNGYQSMGGLRPDLAGKAVQSAAGFAMTSVTPAGLVTFVDYDSDPATGIITIAVDTVPNNDPWLRTDGLNDMNAAVGFSGPGYDIDNADDIEASTFTDRDNPGFSVDPDGTSAMNEILSNTVNSDVVVANTIQGTNSAFNASAIGQLSVDEISGQNAVFDTVAADVFVDKNDSSYFVDPNGVSRLEDVIVGSRGDLPLSRLLPNIVKLESYVVTHDSVVPKPSCATGGTPHIILMANQTESILREPGTEHGDNHDALAAESAIDLYRAIDTGSDWTIEMLTYNYDSTAYETAPNDLMRGVVEVSCYYPT